MAFPWFLLAAGLPASGGLGSDLVRFEFHHYILDTDLPPERAEKIGRLMDATGQEFNRRFQGFRGLIRRKPKLTVFYLRDDYLAALARAVPGSDWSATRGVFVSSDETVYTYEGDDGVLHHVLRHECFHQFVHFVVGGRLPPWANEGLAEYFAEGVWDERSGRLLLGTVSGHRAKFLQTALEAGELLSIDDLLTLSHDAWNDSMAARGSVHYQQAWALCHFLVHAEGGKYERFFNDYLRHIDRGLDPDSAFERAFGRGTGALQEKYVAYVRTLRPTGETVKRGASPSP